MEKQGGQKIPVMNTHALCSKSATRKEEPESRALPPPQAPPLGNNGRCEQLAAFCYKYSLKPRYETTPDTLKEGTKAFQLYL